ncbi:hypothetical protein P3T43_001779 [Paraburkholderia sp. GAS41]|uniref:hypothetical protein n=1 Tax=Paraburkholderia sp. GAS41 TaxID=3035134 RepID=UPI003D19A54E
MSDSPSVNKRLFRNRTSLQNTLSQYYSDAIACVDLIHGDFSGEVVIKFVGAYIIARASIAAGKIPNVEGTGVRYMVRTALKIGGHHG